MSREISNSDDVIDSRDVIARIEELEAEIEDLMSKPFGEQSAEHRDLLAELEPLKALANAAEDYCDDWKYGATLVRYSYFHTYAQELAEDIGAIPKAAAWPCSCIDWEQAARELQMDYTSVEFDGVTYWVR